MSARLVSLLGLAALGILAAAWWIAPGRPSSTAPGRDAAPPRHVAAARLPTPAEPSARGVPARVSAAAPTPDEARGPALAEPALAGRVVDEQGLPVSGAQVFALHGQRLADRLLGPDELLRRTPDAGARAVSAADGAFRIPQPAEALARVQRVSVRADGFAPLEHELVAQDGVRAALELVLERSVVLEGLVRDATGAAVAGAVLRGLDAVNRSGSPATDALGEPLATSDAAGAFRIDRLARGPWKLLVSAAGHPDALVTGVTQAPGEVVMDLVIVLADGRTIAGRVVAAPELLSGVIVRALPSRATGEVADGRTPLPRSARCDDDGGFVVQGLDDGWVWRVAAWRDERAATARPDSGWVEAEGGARELVLRFEQRAALAFRAVDAASGAALEELEVRIGCGFPVALVDEDGRVRRRFADGRVLAPVPAGCDGSRTLELWLSAPGHEDRTLRDVAWSAGGTLDLGALALEPVASLALRIVAAGTETPVEGAVLTVLARSDGPDGQGAAPADALRDSPPPWAATRSDADGRARVNARRGGVLLVTHVDFAPLALELADGARPGDVELALELGRGGGVQIEVTDPGGAPLAGVWVRRSGDATAAHAAGAVLARTDAAGRAAFEHLAPGLHRFRVDDSARPSAADPAAVEVLVVEGGVHAQPLVVAHD